MVGFYLLGNLAGAESTGGICGLEKIGSWWMDLAVTFMLLFYLSSASIPI